MKIGLIKWGAIFLWAWGVSLMAMSPGNASDENAYARGKSLAKESNLTKDWDLKGVPGFKEPSTISETSINEKNIENRIGRSLQTSESAGLVQDTYNNRSRFDLDVKSDPLFTDADKVIANPTNKLNLKAQTKVMPAGVTRHQCTKGYDLLEKKCRYWKVATKIGTRLINKTYVVNLLYDYIRQKDPNYFLVKTSNTWAIFDWEIKEILAPTNPHVLETFKNIYPGIDAVNGNVIPIDLRYLKSVLLSDLHGRISTDFFNLTAKYAQFTVISAQEEPLYELRDVNDCDNLEGQADTGACSYSSKRCIEGPQTRMVDGTPVYADCWAEEAIYQCRTVEEDQCKEWAKKGCVQIGSKCINFLEAGHCIRWQQTYECTHGKRQSKIMTLEGKKPFCLDGTCVDQTWDGNGDMIDALAKLAIFKEMQNGLDAKAELVFKGKSLGCSRVLGSFKDCCTLAGWGKKIGLSNCDDNAQELAESRKLNKCVHVGTYCAERKLGVCIRRKTTFCCYNNKLSRLINEQGKHQLNSGFGSAEYPDCKGLTLNEISRIDFSLLDLSDLFSEMAANLKTPNTTAINQDIQKSMANKTYTITDKKKEITQGRQHGNF